MSLMRQEPYRVRACPACKRQLRNATSTCCNGEYGKTIYCVPAEQHRGAVAERDEIIRELVAANETNDGATGLIESRIGKHAAATLHAILE